MKKINFNLPEQQFVEINGEQYPIVQSDIQILEPEKADINEQL